MAGVGLANVVSKAVTVSKLVQAGGKVAKTLTVAGDMAADATVSVTSQLVEKKTCWWKICTNRCHGWTSEWSSW